ncbi:MAG: hypothetical protein KKE73_06540 [Proteobacteria bacterium]|nr:hypothetical protein [Pseudomonadota bacterium]
MRLICAMALPAMLAFLLSLSVPGVAMAMNENLAAQPGEEFQLCTCLGTEADAQRLVAKARETVDGLQVRIQPREIDGRTVYEIWAHHPLMSPHKICNALGRASCSSARRECGQEGEGHQ